MTIDAKKLYTILETHTDLTVPTSTEADVVSNISYSLDFTKSLIHTQTVERGIQFALWSDFWNKYGTYGKRRRTFRDKAYRPGKRIAKGTVLEVDLGHYNISPELSYGHYGIVVADHFDLVVVAPVTTDRRSLGKQRHLANYKNAVIEVPVSQYPMFDHDSLVLIHQSRSVGKNRIYGKLGSVAGTPLMQLIEEQYLERYSTTEYHKLKKEIKQLTQQLQDKEKEIATLLEQTEAGLKVAQMTAAAEASVRDDEKKRP